MAELGALDLDFLKQIVDVHWAGESVFAIGGTQRDATKEGPIGVFYSQEDGDEWGSTHMDPDSPAPTTVIDDRPVPSGGQGPRAPGMWNNAIFSMVGGTVTIGDEEKKVLVAVGGRIDMVGINDEIYDGGQLISWHYNYHSIATIFWSDDGGETWHEAANPITDEHGLHLEMNVICLYVCFDPAAQMFYADVQKQGERPSGVSFETVGERHLISSPDGKTWTAGPMESSIVGSGNFTSPFLQRITSIKNNGLTEIINTDADPEIKLTYTTISVGPDPFGGRITLEPPWKITPAPTGELAEGCIALNAIPHGALSSGGLMQAGIAYANGLFLIAGSLLAGMGDSTDYTVQAYLCGDDGMSWKKVLNDSTTFMINDTINYDPPYCAGSCGCAGA